MATTNSEKDLLSSITLDVSCLSVSGLNTTSAADSSMILSHLNVSAFATPARRSSSAHNLTLSGMGRQNFLRSENPFVGTPTKSNLVFSGFLTPRRGKQRTQSADRYIPSRAATNFDRAGFLFVNHDSTDALSPNARNRQLQLKERLFGTKFPESGKIMSYRKKTGSVSDPVVGSRSSEPEEDEKSNGFRRIKTGPDRILDAPDIRNDYYLNLLDWSSDNCIAVSLQECVYIWNATTGEVKLLMELENEQDYICSVKFVDDGSLLAVGDSLGHITIWDLVNWSKLRLMEGHAARVSSLSWNKHILSSGDKSGEVRHSDVRVASHRVANFAAHEKEVAGMAWSPDGRHLATGGNDNVLKVWAGTNDGLTEQSPKYVITQHEACVKAVAWCPWQPGILASGAGTIDRTIKIWNCNNGGRLLKSVDTKSQVSSIVWSPHYREIASSHGFPNNNIVLWKYPSMTRIAEFNGHSDRVLSLCLSADKSILASGGADETLQLWKCFPNPEKQRGATASVRPNLSKIDQSKVINRTGLR